jgi:hypothetical protein
MERCSGLNKNGAQCKRVGASRCHQHLDENNCAICFGHMTAPTTRTLGCQHSFHKRCIERWKRTSHTCPVCRAPFDQPIYKVSINIQCIHDGQNAIHTYETPDINQLARSFGLDLSLMRSSIADITFDIDNHENIEDLLHSLGISSFSLPDTNAVRPT